MKQLIFSGMALVFVAAPGIVAATCADDGYMNRLDEVQIESRLGGSRVLAISPTSPEEWHQDHCSNGNLFKVGTIGGPPKYPSRPSVDPRAYRGTWAATGTGADALVKYNYVGRNSPFEWSLWSDTEGRLCWQDPATDDIVATALIPGTNVGDCTDPAP